MSTSELRPFFVALVPALASGALAACDTVECGANTIKMDNVCVAEATDPGADCGPGTVWNATSGRCENSLFEGGGLCGENTIVLVNDAGVRTCVGTGSGSGDCNQPLPCPAPSANNLTLCGRVFDLDDSSPLDDGDSGNGEPWRGVELRVYDPIAFIATPSSPPLLTTTPDSCGRFVIADVARPTDAFIAVATDDLTSGGADTYVLTGIAAPTTAGETLAGLRAWVFRRSTDMTWSTAAGLGGTTTFSQMGVYIPIFVSGAAKAPFPASPTAGVTIASLDQHGVRTTNADSDFYFDDSDPLTRSTLSKTRTMTGANGTGLYMNAGLGQYSGLGGAPGGSCWAKDLAAGPVGGAFVEERTASPDNCP
jgi:hypothetical protein